MEHSWLVMCGAGGGAGVCLVRWGGGGACVYVLCVGGSNIRRAKTSTAIPLSRIAHDLKLWKTLTYTLLRGSKKTLYASHHGCPPQSCEFDTHADCAPLPPTTHLISVHACVLPGGRGGPASWHGERCGPSRAAGVVQRPGACVCVCGGGGGQLVWCKDSVCGGGWGEAGRAWVAMHSPVEGRVQAGYGVTAYMLCVVS